MPASPTHTSTEVEIITLGRIYVQTAYLLPLWIFKICDLRNALKTVFSSRHTCMVRLLIVLVPLCLSLVFLGFFCRCFEEPYVVFGDVHPAESTCRFYWALLASILLSVLYVHSVQCIGKLQAKFQLVIFFFFVYHCAIRMLALILYIHFYCEFGKHHRSGADCRRKVKLSIYSSLLFLWAYILPCSDLNVYSCSDLIIIFNRQMSTRPVTGLQTYICYFRNLCLC